MRKYVIEWSMACLLLVSFYFLSRQAAQVSAELGKQANTEKMIIVDPGHGGKDPGMVGVGGLEEKGINLEISLILRDILEERGWNVFLTRESDRGLYDETADNKKAQDLQRRIALINEKNPVLTVSIHQNSYKDQTVKGPQVFYYKSSKEGKKLAECIQETMNEQLEIQRPRKAKANNSYYLLKKSKGIVNIVETGFLTNSREAELLQTEEYQRKCAQAISDGILKFLKTVEMKGTDVV